MTPPPDIRRTVDAVFRMEGAKIIASLTRMTRDVGLAEELAQDAVVAARSPRSAHDPPGRDLYDAREPRNGDRAV
jgi:predicted RNA polymerase sigma factor